MTAAMTEDNSVAVETTAQSGAESSVQKTKVKAADAVDSSRDAAAAEDYVRFMRRELCPVEMINPDGTLNDTYFQPKSDLSGVEWDEGSLEELYKGLEEIGVGEWARIKAKYLPIWDDLAIRFKTCLLLGTQDLSSFEGKKMTRDELAAARAQNKAEAQADGNWHFGVKVSKEFGLQYKKTQVSTVPVSST
mmetsp:Transcript_15886/g.30730  ORF Transcript_15886/g.30730 Transcript_15886/m.30730 type:complete len:191 (-) Transcript_15886:52-624(-)